MNRLLFFSIIGITLASCTSNKDLLISSQSRDIATMRSEINELKRERNAARNEIQELENDLADCELRGRSGLNPNDVLPRNSASSELDNLKTRTIPGLQSFLRDGIEFDISVSMAEINSAIAHASTFLGTPHRQGGKSKSGIDCSGLVQVSLEHAGIIGLPRTANELARYGVVIVNPEELSRGDLVFFTDTYSTSNFITHIGIYLGDNQFIHASSSRGVMTSKLMDGDYWEGHYVFGTRIIG